MSLLSFFSSKKESLVAVVDIGSSSVGVALIKSSFNKKSGWQSKIIYTTRTEARLETPYDFRRYIREITKALHQSLNTALLSPPVRQAGKNGVPGKYICFLASPFYIAQTRVVKYEEEAEFVLTPKLYQRITTQEVARFLSHHAEIYPSLIDDTFFVIENKTMQIKLNGYEVTDPFNKKTTRAELVQYISGSSPSLARQFQEEIIKITHHDRIEFHSFAFAAFSVLRDRLGEMASFLIIDVSGEITDVSVVTLGVLTEVTSFPLGRNSLVRQIAANLKTAYAEADSLLRLYISGGTGGEANNRLAKEVAKVKENWLAKMRETLAGALESNILPEQVYVIGDDRTAKIFMDWLTSGDFREFTMSNRPLQIKYLDSSFLNPHHNHEQNTRDVFVLVESLFYDKINHGSR